MTGMAFEVTPENRPPPERTRRFAGIVGGRTAADTDDVDDTAPDRQVSLRAVLDIAGGACLVGGMACGDAAAFMAGGKIPGLATLGGCLITLGVILARG